MILLDTNIVSALMSQDPRVIAWLDEQATESIWLTSITVFETEFGLALLPVGRRRSALEKAFAGLLQEDLDGRVVAFDMPAAAAAAKLAAARQKAGRPVDMRDVQIAGIAIARRAALATRNRRHFDDLPTRVLDPWAGELIGAS